MALQHLGRALQPVVAHEVVPDGQTDRAVRAGDGDDVLRRQREREHAHVFEPAAPHREHRRSGSPGIALERDRRNSGLAEHDREVALARTDVDRALDRLLADDREHRVPARFRALAPRRGPEGEIRDRLVDAVRERVDAEADAVEHVVHASPRHDPLRDSLGRRPAVRAGVGLRHRLPSASAPVPARTPSPARRPRGARPASPRSGPRRRAEPRAARRRSLPAGRTSAEKRLITSPASSEGARKTRTSSFGSSCSWTRTALRLAR